MGKEIVNQLQEAQRVPYRINPRRNTPRHILIKLSKIIYKEGFPGGAVVENLPANAGDRVHALVWEHPTCRRATRPVSHNY